MRQYFYLVVVNYDEETCPQKIFLQEYEAIAYGRGKATEAVNEGRLMEEYVLFRQEINRNGILIRVGTLEPYIAKFKASDVNPSREGVEALSALNKQMQRELQK